VWTFTATAGDRFAVTMGEIASSGFSPWIRVFAPNGTVVASNFGFSAAGVEAVAPVNGTYLVVIGSAGGGFTGTGTYRLTLAKTPAPVTVSPGDQGGALVNGGAQSGEILLGESDVWTFTANAGDHFAVGIGEVVDNGGFSPWIRVWAPNGNAVGSNFGFVAAQVEATAPVTGTYVVVVASAGGGFTGEGTYRMSFAKTPGPITVSAGDQGGALTNGGTHFGEILQGELDVWTFTAIAGDHFAVDMAEIVSSGFSPWIRVFAPNGTVVASNFGFAAAHVDAVAPVTGTHLVVVGSAAGGFTGTGTYQLSFAKTPGS
jgi:hypothetical protein